jgi:Fur family ferric uptake transcriptional regulator
MLVRMTDAAERIAEAGLRVTRQRVAVLDAIGAGEHLDADTLLARVQQALGSVSTQTIYDVLHAMDRAGLVRRIEPAHQPARYEQRVGDNHHPLVCRECGIIVDIDCATGAAPCLDAPIPEGFIVDEAEVTWWGHCASCAQQLAADHSAAPPLG